MITPGKKYQQTGDLTVRTRRKRCTRCPIFLAQTLVIKSDWAKISEHSVPIINTEVVERSTIWVISPFLVKEYVTILNLKPYENLKTLIRSLGTTSKLAYAFRYGTCSCSWLIKRRSYTFSYGTCRCYWLIKRRSYTFRYGTCSCSWLIKRRWFWAHY